jgi:hypothetical protein
MAKAHVIDAYQLSSFQRRERVGIFCEATCRRQASKVLQMLPNVAAQAKRESLFSSGPLPLDGEG